MNFCSNDFYRLASVIIILKHRFSVLQSTRSTTGCFDSSTRFWCFKISSTDFLCTKISSNQFFVHENFKQPVSCASKFQAPNFSASKIRKISSTSQAPTISDLDSKWSTRETKFEYDYQNFLPGAGNIHMRTLCHRKFVSFRNMYSSIL